MIFFKINIRNYKSFGHHHSDEFFIVNMAISIKICLSDHFVDFIISEFLSQVCHNMSQFGGRNKSVSISIEHFEGFDQLFLGVRILFMNKNEELSTFIFLAIRVRNSGKSMVPFPSASTSLIMSCSSASVGF